MRRYGRARSTRVMPLARAALGPVRAVSRRLTRPIARDGCTAAQQAARYGEAAHVERRATLRASQSRPALRHGNGARGREHHRDAWRRARRRRRGRRRRPGRGEGAESARSAARRLASRCRLAGDRWPALSGAASGRHAQRRAGDGTQRRRPHVAHCLGTCRGRCRPLPRASHGLDRQRRPGGVHAARCAGVRQARAQQVQPLHRPWTDGPCLRSATAAVEFAARQGWRPEVEPPPTLPRCNVASIPGAGTASSGKPVPYAANFDVRRGGIPKWPPEGVEEGAPPPYDVDLEPKTGSSTAA